MPNLSCFRDLALVVGFSRLQDSWLSWQKPTRNAGENSRCIVGKCRVLALVLVLDFPVFLSAAASLSAGAWQPAVDLVHWTDLELWWWCHVFCSFRLGVVMTCSCRFLVIPVSSVLRISSFIIFIIDFLYKFHLFTQSCLYFLDCSTLVYYHYQAIPTMAVCGGRMI